MFMMQTVLNSKSNSRNFTRAEVVLLSVVFDAIHNRVLAIQDTGHVGAFQQISQVTYIFHISYNIVSYGYIRDNLITIIFSDTQNTNYNF